jgi:hypothetical protein
MGRITAKTPIIILATPFIRVEVRLNFANEYLFRVTRELVPVTIATIPRAIIKSCSNNFGFTKVKTPKNKSPNAINKYTTQSFFLAICYLPLPQRVTLAIVAVLTF